MHRRLEDLPNELLFNIFEYTDTRDLFYGFWRLNQRFNNLLQSLDKLSLTCEKNESKLISVFGAQIYRLVVDTCLDINFTRLPYLHSLILHDVTEIHLKQIQTNFMPYLVYLSIPSDNRSWLVHQLIQQIFSPQLSSLITINLACRFNSMVWAFQSHSLQSISVSCTSSMMLIDILISCPNLSYLRVYLERNEYNVYHQSRSIVKHSLKHFIVLDPFGILNFNDMEIFLGYMPKIERIRLNFICDVPFVNFARMIAKQLSYLCQLYCYIDITCDDDMISIETIQQIHPCFYRIQCITDDYGYRTFTTDLKKRFVRRSQTFAL